jgi:hypothetical protein
MVPAQEMVEGRKCRAGSWCCLCFAACFAGGAGQQDDLAVLRDQTLVTPLAMQQRARGKGRVRSVRGDTERRRRGRTGMLARYMLSTCKG